ncbi:MAG: hypothetical protein P0Y49_14085 [Candidatus Pedobacter colombiensis]|uniref:DUF1554 domain-containing protein n=1 Tax=Candidatus Pedobacter colombiensis TaxID=3121371 RepID=A0AAJ6B7C6_9SPHI|nr:hypothetical protein [Pedobacter sp.]WEK17928.1 MAG: hypothetical protein P0Y49_14085 [Pedobacter sp.]
MKKTITFASIAIVAIALFFACKKAGENSSFNSPNSKSSGIKALVACNFVTLSGTLTTQTLSAANVYKISGIVRIPSGVTLTIPAGTVLQGIKSATTAWLVIEKGGKLIATGTSSNPIVFTSDQNAGARAAGDWGGIAFAGNAPTNVSTGLDIPLSGSYTLSGGSSISADNSGNLQYVQIHFAGKGYTNDASKSALLLNAVGTGTAIDHVQISNAQYDGIGSYGGTVKQTYMISLNAGRTDFPISYGYTGKIQFIAAMRMINGVTPTGPAYGLDISNDPTGTNNTPLTQPVISNATVLGPNYCNSTAVNSNFQYAVRFNNNGAGKIYNSVFSSWNATSTSRGLLINGNSTISQTASNNLEFSYNSFHNSGVTPYTSSLWTGGCESTMARWIEGTGVASCKESGYQVVGVSDLDYNSSFCSAFCDNGFISNFTLGTNTDLDTPNFSWDTGNSFNHPVYRGAFGGTDFTQSWSNWCPLNTVYCS